MDQISSASLTYMAAIERAAFYREPSFGALRLHGADRIAFLQRQTTNDMQLLAEGRGVKTVMTNPAGRILDVLTVLQQSESLLILTLPGKREHTLRYLRSRIFFMDKVSLEDVTESYLNLLLTGPQARAVLAALELTAPEQLHGSQSVDIRGAKATVIHDLGGLFRLIVETSGQAEILDRFNGHSIPELDETTFDLLRIEAGLPAAGHELAEDYTPFEAGLDLLVADNKGCYTGQEVLARQVTYDKIIRTLVGIKTDQPATAGIRATSLEDDRLAGEITSAAVSPRFGPIALAVLRRPWDQPGTTLKMNQAGQEINGTVIELPFR